MFQYLHLKPMADLPPLPFSGPFSVAIVVDASMTDGWRNRVCDWLALAGCRSMSAWGVDASAWDDAMDWANIAMFEPHAIPDEHFILTTWATDESLPEFLEEFQCVGRLAERPVEQQLLLHIGMDERREALMQAWSQSSGGI